MLQKYDDRNASIKVWIKDKLMDRKNAMVSVFDSSVQGGDAVWEGIRVYRQGVFCLDRHLDRLEDSARAMAFSDIPSREFIKNAIFETLRVNKMTDGFVKILSSEDTDQILGVHILGAHAGTMIAEAAVAMEFEATSEDLAHICHAHPTLSEAVKEAALAIDDRALHM